VIALYSDYDLTSCQLFPVPGYNVIVYVVHETSSGASGANFTIKNVGATGLTYLSEAPAWTYDGNTQHGIKLTYGGCTSGQFSVVVMFYLNLSSSPPCSYLELAPHPASSSGRIEGIDCLDNEVYPIGGRLTINPDGNCPCGAIVPIEEKTWGYIKSLYK